MFLASAPHPQFIGLSFREQSGLGLSNTASTELAVPLLGGRRGSMRKYRGLSTLKQCGGLPEGGNAYS